MQPLEFQMVGDTAYVKVPVQGCALCKLLDNPEDSTIYLLLRDGRWQRTDSSQFPSASWSNLMQEGIFDERDPKGDISGHVDLQSKPPHWRAQGLEIAQRSFCRRECGNVFVTTGNLKIEFEAKSSSSFCRE